MMETQENHARQNAVAGMANIREMVAALTADRERLQELRDERESLVEPDDNPCDSRTAEEWDASEEGEELRDLEAAVKIDGDEVDEETARERIQEDPLSIQVRSGWHSLGQTLEPAEFEILLTTGGPALRIVGDLGSHNEPDRPRLQFQDWFTPWEELILESEDMDALQTYCEVFCFDWA